MKKLLAIAVLLFGVTLLRTAAVGSDDDGALDLIAPGDPALGELIGYQDELPNWSVTADAMFLSRSAAQNVSILTDVSSGA